MSHRESLFVISGLLSGGDTSFQICTTRGRTRLAACIRGIQGQLAFAQHVHRVLAGDIGGGSR